MSSDWYEFGSDDEYGLDYDPRGPAPPITFEDSDVDEPPPERRYCLYCRDKGCTICDRLNRDTRVASTTAPNTSTLAAPSTEIREASSRSRQSSRSSPDELASSVTTRTQSGRWHRSDGTPATNVQPRRPGYHHHRSEDGSQARNAAPPATQCRYIQNISHRQRSVDGREDESVVPSFYPGSQADAVYEDCIWSADAPNPAHTPQAAQSQQTPVQYTQNSATDQQNDVVDELDPDVIGWPSDYISRRRR